jgi:hypothetical protein
LFPLWLHWQLRVAQQQCAANEYPRSESNRHWGPF